MGTSPDSSPTDADLVATLRRDRTDTAFGALYDRHTPRLLQTVWRVLGGNTHEAEDVVQEVWVRAIETLDAWRQNEAFGAWLRGIAVHVAIDLLRRGRRLQFTDELEVATPEPTFERLDLERAIAALPAGYRAVLVLHDVEGFTHEEIGRQLGITAGTSKGQLFKARRAVRARLAIDTTENAR